MPSRTGIIRKRWKERILAGEVILCTLCGDPVPAKAKGKDRITRGGKGAISVDHITPRSKGGSSILSNLQPTHALCNGIKGDSTYDTTEPAK